LAGSVQKTATRLLEEAYLDVVAAEAQDLCATQ
jgi:hypothetical protein